MAAEEHNPRFLSLRYHTVFFPSVLTRCTFRTKRSEGATSFTSNLEMMVCLAVCAILSIVGLPSAITGKSVVGWIMTVVGGGGIILLLAISIGAQWGSRPSYSTFLAWVFFFFVSLGLFVGIPVGMDHHSFLIGAATSLCGLIVGYSVGIFAGLQLQRLGWLAVALNFAAAFGTVVVIGTALVIAVLVAAG